MPWHDKTTHDLTPGGPPHQPRALKQRTPGPPTGLTYPDHWWDDQLWKALREADRYRVDLDKITIPDPPDATKTAKELKDLMDLQASDEREKRRPEILEEAEGPPAYYRRALMLDENRNPLSRALIMKSVPWSVPLILHFKFHWKRPRPSQLQPLISPMVDIPGHPAYPSGHSTQSHLIAWVIGAISGRDDVRDAFMQKADRIAQNREYAGLHYASDSAAGVVLAEQLYPLFERDYGKQIAEAREKEWSIWD